MVVFIVVLLIVGFIVGAIARLLMPGRDSLGIFGTIVLGVVGSFVGGFLQKDSSGINLLIKLSNFGTV
jgi:uncharacterized membrane protein YeaQ/YmgE (transglycosylase-associated protein family)